MFQEDNFLLEIFEKNHVNVGKIKIPKMTK